MYSSRPKFIILMALARDETLPVATFFCAVAIVLHSTRAAIISAFFILFCQLITLYNDILFSLLHGIRKKICFPSCWRPSNALRGGTEIQKKTKKIFIIPKNLYICSCEMFLSNIDKNFKINNLNT
jgi:hypothetical protein